MNHAFLELALTEKIIEFGDFTLKSGLKSPYFFNLGKINNGSSLWELASFYAEIIIQHKLQFDILFGPAYKGIPLVTTTAILLSQKLNQPIPFAFNRKELKNHGEGGIFIGAPLKNKRVLLLDDVITAGTAIKQSISLLDAEKAQLTGIVVALDRQEQSLADNNKSIIKTLQNTLNIPIKSITSLHELIKYTTEKPNLQNVSKILIAYQKKHGASS